MNVTPYLSFDGTCEEAFKFYEKCLGGKIAFMMTWGESPMADQAPPGWGGKIMHTTLTVGDQKLQGADVPAGQYEKPRGIELSLGLNDPAQAERIFAELSEGGAVNIPLAETFWALRFGEVRDRFGTPWIINCEKPVES